MLGRECSSACNEASGGLAGLLTNGGWFDSPCSTNAVMVRVCICPWEMVEAVKYYKSNSIVVLQPTFSLSFSLSLSHMHTHTLRGDSFLKIIQLFARTRQCLGRQVNFKGTLTCTNGRWEKEDWSWTGIVKKKPKLSRRCLMRNSFCSCFPYLLRRFCAYSSQVNTLTHPLFVLSTEDPVFIKRQ